MPERSSRIAVLIDSDNVSAEHIGNILRELAKFGTTSIRRMYGDWTADKLRGWKSAANDFSIQPIQQFAYTTGKNATDSALIIEAMDLLHQNDLDAFALVSSDSDFTRLASRLRESGKRVFGFGERKTPIPFIKACDVFTYLDVLEDDSTEESAEPGASATPKNSPEKLDSRKLKGDTKLVNLLRAGISAGSDEDGWAGLAEVGSTIQKQSPEFDSRNWGYAKLSDLINAVGLFEVRKLRGVNGSSHLRARIKPKK